MGKIISDLSPRAYCTFFKEGVLFLLLWCLQSLLKCPPWGWDDVKAELCFLFSWWGRSVSVFVPLEQPGSTPGFQTKSISLMFILRVALSDGVGLVANLLKGSWDHHLDAAASLHQMLPVRQIPIPAGGLQCPQLFSSGRWKWIN